jgi:hypothetical protein
VNIISTYKPKKLQLSCYLISLKNILKTMPINFPTFILSYLNADTLIENLHSIILQEFMVSYNLHLFFSKKYYWLPFAFKSHLDKCFTTTICSRHLIGLLNRLQTNLFELLNFKLFEKWIFTNYIKSCDITYILRLY